MITVRTCLRRWRPGLALLLVVLLVSACGTSSDRQDGAPKDSQDVSRVPDAVPRSEPPSRSGNPKSYVVWGKRYTTISSSAGFRERGIASWYGKKFHGRRTSSGETYDMYAMTAAHKNLPLPTYVKVRNLENGRSVVVRVNDRGPFHQGRVIDLSYTAASKLGIVGRGTGQVEVTALPPYQTLGGARKVAHQPPPANSAAASKPARAQPVTGQDNAFVQIGAFSSLENAERLRARIQSELDRPVSIQSVPDSSAAYRVRVGPIPYPSGTDELHTQLAALGIHQTRVIPH